MADSTLPLFDNVLVIGAGLIGGSLAKAMRERSLASWVVGFGRNQQALQQGVDLGVLDAVAESLEHAIAAADLIVLAVPTLTVEDYISVIQQYKKTDAIVTDVASVKGEIAAFIEKQLGELPPWFILGHPIAGSEQSGIAASNAQLFVQHKVILTPVANTSPQALALVSKLWQAVGAEVVEMSISEHDHVLAATSHLPHALAFTLVDTLRQMDESVDIFRFAAGGFRDFSRIASSHPVMWHDIMLSNKQAILSVMGNFKETLGKLEQAMLDDDSATIMAMFERAKVSRDEFALLLAERDDNAQ